MSDHPMQERTSEPAANSIFTIIGGTTIPDRASIVRTYCREGSEVELRRDPDDNSCIGVWLPCPMIKGLLKSWKRIGEVPAETGEALLTPADVSSTVVARGTVRTVYAPVGRDEAVVTVELRPQVHEQPGSTGTTGGAI
jgi:hypothetical protein